MPGAHVFHALRTATHGTYEGSAVTDNIDRLAGFRHLSGLPFIVVVALPIDGVYAPWRSSSLLALGLLMIDIDGFKAFNDRYGHPRGDDALAAIGSAIGSELRRPTDLAARYGGEEFAAIVPATDSVGTIAVASAIHERIRAWAIVHAESATGFLTVSIGVAVAMPRGDDPSPLLDAADAALYRAKTSGRDRTCVAGEIGPQPAGACEPR